MSQNRQGQKKPPQNRKKRKGRRSNKTLGITLAAVAVVLAGACVFGYFYLDNLSKENAVGVTTCYDGIYVDDISIGGMSREEAKAVIEEKQRQETGSYSVAASFEDMKWEFTIADVEHSYNTDDVLNEAFALGREGTVKERYQYIEELKENPVKLETEITIDASSLRGRVEEIGNALYVAPVDASIKSFDPKLVEEERFTFEVEQVGREADTDKLFTELKESFESKSFAPVAVTVVDSQPAILMEDLKNTTQLISTYTTKMEKNSNREHNVELACNTISGTILMPGEEFSFNGTTGPRSSQAGYKEAGVIIAGEPDTGLGGGVCQVSGTLYNAVFMADLNIVERTRHSYVLGYLPAGRDATVDYPSKDFKFRNDGTSPVYVVMYADRGELTVTAQIYGVPLANGEKVDIDAKITATKKAGERVYQVDSKLEPGKTKDVKARTGYNVTVYKVYKDAAGNELRRVEMYKDNYPSIPPKTYYAPGEHPLEQTPEPTVTPPVTNPDPPVNNPDPPVDQDPGTGGGTEG